MWEWVVGECCGGGSDVSYQRLLCVFVHRALCSGLVLFFSTCRAHGQMKYDPGEWSGLLDKVHEYLSGIYRVFGAWQETSGTPADDAFDN